MKTKLKARSLFFVCALALATTAANAVVLWPGDMANLNGTSEAAEPWLAGTVIEDNVQPFSVTSPYYGTITGYVQDRVVRETSTGNLDFYTRLWTDDSRLIDSGSTLTRDNYRIVPHNTDQSVYTDVDYRTDGVGIVAPINAWRSSDGKTIGFTFFEDVIGPGPDGSTNFMMISTKSKKYNGAGHITLNLNGGTVTLPGFQPLL